MHPASPPGLARASPCKSLFSASHPHQVAITLTLTRLLGKLFGYIKQPQVIGEIVAGILLGPSVLGQIPGAWWGAFAAVEC